MILDGEEKQHKSYDLDTRSDICKILQGKYPSDPFFRRSAYLTPQCHSFSYRHDLRPASLAALSDIVKNVLVTTAVLPGQTLLVLWSANTLEVLCFCGSARTSKSVQHIRRGNKMGEWLA
jgi:hypothetical protein